VLAIPTWILEKHQVSLKPANAAGAAVVMIALSGALCAQPAPVIDGGTVAVPAAAAPVVEGNAAAAPVAQEPDAAEPSAAATAIPVTGLPASSASPTEDAAAGVKAAADEAAAAQDYKRRKMNEATAADDKFHANRSQANMLARDRAEAEAAEAIRTAQAADDRARAAKQSNARAGNPR
jgi:hypothetical protein